MDNESKLRPLYLGKILYEQTDEENYLTTAQLIQILEEKYGKATRIEHEFPFSEIIDGQTIVGSIDLVWFTSENECVLVDIKNRPGATRLVLKPDDRRFLGQYAPQLNAYRTALERGGLTVKDSIIYLAMQAEAIRITC